MANNESAGVKKEKRTTDNNDDPFGELDWKDGIATLPGNVTLKNSVTDFYRLPRIFIFTDFYLFEQPIYMYLCGRKPNNGPAF